MQKEEMKMIDNRVWDLLKIVISTGGLRTTSDNTAYTLRAYALALRDIAPFSVAMLLYMLGTLCKVTDNKFADWSGRLVCIKK